MTTQYMTLAAKVTIALVASCNLVAGFAHTLRGHIVSIADGDTLTVLDAAHVQHKVRLVGIDAPESEQPFGTVSKQNLSNLVFGKQVTVEYQDKDRYGRTLGKILSNGQDINLEQIEDGFAWHYKHYQSDQSLADREAYAKVEIDARKAGRGLWTDAHAIPSHAIRSPMYPGTDM
jgi:endonuclease YncB( thermonuclease family)